MKPLLTVFLWVFSWSAFAESDDELTGGQLDVSVSSNQEPCYEFTIYRNNYPGTSYATIYKIFYRGSGDSTAVWNDTSIISEEGQVNQEILRECISSKNIDIQFISSQNTAISLSSPVTFIISAETSGGVAWQYVSYDFEASKAYSYLSLDPPKLDTSTNLYEVDFLNSSVSGLTATSTNTFAHVQAAVLEIGVKLPSDSTDTNGDGDGDGVLDVDDAFPLDESESLDTDSDGIGNNADTDDDGDGVLDTSDALPLDASETVDTDGDDVGDNSDAFPIDPNESSDYDDDGIGDNSDNCMLVANNDQTNTDGDAEGNECDLDDDNDGFTDEQELIDGTNPLDARSCLGCYSVFDVDADGEVKALSDGLLLIRYFFGFTGDTLVGGAVNNDGERTSAEEIESYLESHMP